MNVSTALGTGQGAAPQSASNARASTGFEAELAGAGMVGVITARIDLRKVMHRRPGGRADPILPALHVILPMPRVTPRHRANAPALHSLTLATPQ
jgi:hypothetical protein